VLLLPTIGYVVVGGNKVLVYIALRKAAMPTTKP